MLLAWVARVGELDPTPSALPTNSTVQLVHVRWSPCAILVWSIWSGGGGVGASTSGCFQVCAFTIGWNSRQVLTWVEQELRSKHIPLPPEHLLMRCVLLSFQACALSPFAQPS